MKCIWTSTYCNYLIILQVTKESFTDDGFFKTGDAVKVDEDGYYVILGRKWIYILIHVVLLSIFLFPIFYDEFGMYFYIGTSADIMKVGGYKLSALEIESILLEVMSPYFHFAAFVVCNDWDCAIGSTNLM